MTDLEIRAKLLEAAKMHVPFDGWSDASFQAAIRDTGIEPGLARAACPGGATDLALTYHEEGDQLMLERLTTEDMSQMRFRDRIAAAVRFRLEAPDDKELVRRGVTLFSLPSHGAEGARAIWNTCDKIWTALGDTSDDVNWYTKRATLSAVYSATLLFWLGDESPEHADTWAFLDRRIDDVMRFEKFKAQIRDNKLLSGLLAGPLKVLDGVRAPRADAKRQQTGMPGRWTMQG